MQVALVAPKDRLNVQSTKDHPDRLSPIAQYRCPACSAITAFPMPAQVPARVFDDDIQMKFDALTERKSAHYPAIADGRCRGCGRCFRVIADYDEDHPGHFVYDVIAVLELIDQPIL